MDPILFVFITMINILTSWEGWIGIGIVVAIGYAIWRELRFAELVADTTATAERVAKKASTLEEMIVKESRRTGKYNDTNT
jgi:hypothetical protein